MSGLSSSSEFDIPRVCVATPGLVGESETFINAHLRNLPFPLEHISGYGSNYQWNGLSVRELIEKSDNMYLVRGLNLLPRFVEFRVRKRWLPRLSEAAVVARFLKSQRINVVLAEYGTSGAFMTPACVAAGVPLVVHFHGFDAVRFDTLEKFRNAYLRMFEYASSVIAVSKKMCRDLIELGCPEGKIVVSHYGPDPLFFDVTPDSASNNILMVGRLTEKKAPYLSLMAFREVVRKFPELALTIVGSGELEGICRDLVSALSLKGHVDFAGQLSPEQIREKMRNSFLFIQHSMRASSGDCEGTPVAILEAGAAGLPVVSTRHAGIPDVVESGKGGILVEERDIDGMAKAIISFAAERNRARDFGQAARNRIMHHFTMEMHIQQISKAIRRAHYNRTGIES